MAVKLAGQGLNIVLVALPDSHLQETYAFLSKSYPGIACRAVSAWLPCMAVITAVVQAELPCASRLVWTWGSQGTWHGYLTPHQTLMSRL